MSPGVDPVDQGWFPAAALAAGVFRVPGGCWKNEGRWRQTLCHERIWVFLISQWL